MAVYFAVKIWLSHSAMSHSANSIYRLIKIKMMFALVFASVSIFQQFGCFSFEIAIELKFHQYLMHWSGRQRMWNRLEIKIADIQIKMWLCEPDRSLASHFYFQFWEWAEWKKYNRNQILRTILWSGQWLKTVGVGHQRTASRDACIFNNVIYMKSSLFFRTLHMR